MKRIIIVLAFIAFFSNQVIGQSIPGQINYQGVLKDAQGNSVKDTSYTMVFRIYTDTTGGAALWTETQNVPVVNGLFSVKLGSVTPISTLPFDRAYFLGITVGTGEELKPRTLLSPSPYAFTALNVVDNSITTDKIKDGAVTRSKLGADINISQGSGITKVNAGSGLTGGGDSADVTLNVGAGYGIKVTADLVTLDTSLLKEKFVNVNSSGKVGIGTSNPLAKLDVRGNINAGVNGAGGILTLASLDNSSKGGQIKWNGAGSNDSWTQESIGNNMRFSTNSANINNLEISNTGDGTAGLKVQGNLQVGIDTTYDSKMIVNGNSSLYALNVMGGSTYCLGTYWNGSGLGAALVCVNDGTAGDAIQVLANGSGRSAMYTRGSSKVDYTIYSDANGSKWAGYFAGNVYVNGRLTKSAGSFKIDDPLDPANKYLSHSFVESPDMKNIYDGIAVLDNKGEAVVVLPDYFEALNKDFRYQLTCIGKFAPVYIAEEISNNRFKIAGGKAGMKVSWMVTGIRHDAYAEKNRIPVEEMKAPEDRGKYLHPEVFGLPPSRAINYQESPTGNN